MILISKGNRVVLGIENDAPVAKVFVSAVLGRNGNHPSQAAISLAENHLIDGRQGNCARTHRATIFLHVIAQPLR